jgi:hypothetical protein
MSTLTVISRAEAKAQGLTRYFTGEPCAHGHIAERRVSTYKCDACYLRLREYQREAARKSYAKHRDSRLAKQQAYSESHKDQIAEKCAKWFQRNKKHATSRNLAWLHANPEKRRHYDNKRRTRNADASPIWFGEFDEMVMEHAAALAVQRERLFGFEWEIDHVFPLQGKSVSGLHCGNNIAVVPKSVNRKKHNKLIYTEPGAWLQGV